MQNIDIKFIINLSNIFWPPPPPSPRPPLFRISTAGSHSFTKEFGLEVNARNTKYMFTAHQQSAGHNQNITVNKYF